MTRMTMRRRCTALAGAALTLGAWLASPLVAQDTEQDVRSEIEALKKGQDEIKQQLEELKKLIQARPAAPAGPAGPDVEGKVFDLLSNPVQGEATAKLTLVEFTDYQ